MIIAMFGDGEMNGQKAKLANSDDHVKVPNNKFQKELSVFIFRRVLCMILPFLLTAQHALAWSACGHHINAVLTYDLMKTEKQKRLLAILKHHARFVEDFKTPANSTIPEQIAHCCVGRAGYWPDVSCKRRREIVAVGELMDLSAVGMEFQNAGLPVLKISQAQLKPD
jgi:hypothetical protein